MKPGNAGFSARPDQEQPLFGPALDLRQFDRRRHRLGAAGAVGELDGEAFGHLGLHLRHDIRHAPGIDQRNHIDQYAHLQPIEDLGGILRLHVLVHGDETLEADGVGLLLLLRRAAELRLHALDLVDAPVEPFFRRLEQIFADLELARPRIELLATFAEPVTATSGTLKLSHSQYLLGGGLSETASDFTDACGEAASASAATTFEAPPKSRPVSVYPPSRMMPSTFRPNRAVIASKTTGIS